MKKYLLHFTGMHSLKFGSMEEYFLHVAQESNKRGEVSVIQYESIPTSEEYLNKLKSLGVIIEVKPIWTNKLKALINTFIIIRKYQPRIVHAHFINRNGRIFIPLISRLFKIKIILYTVHNQPNFTKKQNSRFLYNMFTKILPVSNAVKSALITGGVHEDIITTHYLGLFGDYKKDLKQKKIWRQKLDVPMSSKVFICIAFDAEFKGLDIFLEAFSIVQKTHSNIYFISVGVDTSKSRLPDLAKKLNIDQRTRWAGVVDKGYQVLNAGDIYVQPSKSEEGLPLAMMEAMAMKLPIVCTDVSGNVESVIHAKNGIVAKRNDSKDLARCMIEMLNTEDKWANYLSEGYDRYNLLFDGNKSVKSLLDKYY